MHYLIERYINKLTTEDINNFALKNNIILNNDELNFTYSFIKKNWQFILTNPNSFNIDKYSSYYTPDNFPKIKKLVLEYQHKYL